MFTKNDLFPISFVSSLIGILPTTKYQNKTFDLFYKIQFFLCSGMCICLSFHIKLGKIIHPASKSLCCSRAVLSLPRFLQKFLVGLSASTAARKGLSRCDLTYVGSLVSRGKISQSSNNLSDHLLGETRSKITLSQ